MLREQVRSGPGRGQDGQEPAPGPWGRDAGHALQPWAWSSRGPASSWETARAPAPCLGNFSGLSTLLCCCWQQPGEAEGVSAGWHFPARKRAPRLSSTGVYRGGVGSRLCGPRFPESSLTLFLDILRHTGMSDEDPATKPQFSKWKATATLYRTANFPVSIWYLRKHAHTCTCSFKRLQKRLKQKRPECWASDQVTPETLCVLTSSAETETASFRSATTCGRKTGIHVTPAKPEQPRRKHRVPKQRGLCAHRLRCALVAPLSPPALVNAVGTRDLHPSRCNRPSAFLVERTPGRGSGEGGRSCQSRAERPASGGFTPATKTRAVATPASCCVCGDRLACPRWQLREEPVEIRGRDVSGDLEPRPRGGVTASAPERGEASPAPSDEPPSTAGCRPKSHLRAALGPQVLRPAGKLGPACAAAGLPSHFGFGFSAHISAVSGAS